MSTKESNIRVAVYVRKFSEKETLLFPERNQEEICTKVIGEYSNAIVHAFQKFKAPFSGKIVHIFPEQSAVI